MQRFFTFVCFLCCIFSAAQRDTYQFTHISTADGLSQSSVIAIHQDNLGQIWIGTRDGLNKYDGNEFTVFRSDANNPKSISNNDILCIEQDENGFIWVGTYNGLNKFDPKTNTFQRFFHSQEKKSLSNNTVWTAMERSNGELWFGTSIGLSIFDKQTESFKTFFNNTSNGIASNQVLSILETRDSIVYLGTSSGLSRLTSNNESYVFETIENTEGLYIQDVTESPNGALLLATRDQSVLEFDPKTNELNAYFNSGAAEDVNQNVRQLLFDDQNQLWVGTYDGLHVVSEHGEFKTLKSSISNAKGLSKNSIKSLFKDSKGSIWIGTYYGGVNIWDSSNVNFVNITQTPGKKGLSYNVVSSIANYKNQIIIATEGGGITLWNREDDRYTYLNRANTPQLSNDNIKSLYENGNGELWIGTFNTGVQVYDLKTKRFNTSIIANDLKNYLVDTGVYSIAQNGDDILWLGTFGKGVLKYNMRSKDFEVFNTQSDSKNKLSSNLVRSVTIDSENNAWVSTEKGLNSVSPSGKISKYFYNNTTESGDDILTVFQDSKNSIWVGTKAKGMFNWDGSKFQNIMLSANNTKVSAVHSILEDIEGNLWVSTNQGLIRYNPQTENTSDFTQNEELLSNEFNDNARLKIGKSQFFFGGPAGVTYFNSEKLTKNQYAPKVIITDFKLKNKSVDLKESDVLDKTISFTNSLDLSYSQGNFSISFASPNFINSKSNSYKYRLKGLEDDWIETTQNSASYTIQNAGNYVFEVKGANSDGVWNDTPTQLQINVSPAPWKSWWAFLIYGFLIFVALYFLMGILKSKAKLQTELQLEHLETERTKETNKAKLEFFTNISHEFRTPLTLILGPLHQILEDYKGNSKMYKKLLVIESSAKHLLQLINRLMDFRKLENNLYTLETAEGNIVKFLKEIYLSFTEFANDGNYDYSFHSSSDEILVYYDRNKLERVFYNLISNAFRYTPTSGKIAVRIQMVENHIQIKVEDSGVGISDEYKDKIFERFFEVAANNQPDNDYNKGTGIGLSIAKNIVNLHKGNIKVENNTNGEGSVFTVSLLLGREHLSDAEILKDFKFSDDVSQYVNQLKNEEVVLDDDISVKIPDADKPKVLLVEDNKPLRKFMRNILNRDYNILEAENGKIALKIAQKESPDLIVSDVIMPVMVGTELCVAIKEDIKTSHIPIILLTSRTALIYKLEGLGSGADDYISKPFDVNEFKLRVKNLLESTSRLKQKFRSEDPFQPDEIIVSSLDEKLYKKALKIVEENIGNEQFDIPFFCSELGVSRTMLFVKVKAWTGFTPNDFIQHFRMKRAAQLLEQGKINISEVSYKVGFKNPKYFSKCFQKKFGETPSQYSNKFSEY